MNEEPPLESDSYLESLLTEDLIDVDDHDSDVAYASGLANMA